MDYAEALDWLKGNRSMTNIIPQEPFDTWQVRIAQADAAMTEQAYWIAKSCKEHLTEELEVTVAIIKQNMRLTEENQALRKMIGEPNDQRTNDNL